MTNAERRRSRRRPILATLSIFIVIPKKGIHRLEVQNISEGGLSFDLDIEGEPIEDFPAKVGDSIDTRFYINHSLFISLSVQIVRIEEKLGVRRVGAMFMDKKAPGYKAFLALIQLLDSLQDVIQIDSAN